MSSYCAFLGHQPHISLAELTVLLPDIKIGKMWSPQIVTFETKADLDGDWLNSVGGTMLIAKSLGTLNEKTDLEKKVPSLLYKQLKDAKKKATFSFRCFNVPRNQIRNLYRSCKKGLKENSLSSRYIGNERNPAKPGTLLLRGIPGPNSCELVILQDKKTGRNMRAPKGTTYWVGQTCAAQDIEAYTSRDVGKPFRDTHTGLMPPKLAQIMLNMASLVTSPDKTKNPCVWDPFCGSGVIMLEALLRRVHVLGSDKSEKAIKGCKENIKWIRHKEKTPKTIISEIWKQNALKKCDLPKTPNVIVTETTLGPPLKKTPTKKEVTTLVRDAEKIELAFFENMAEMLPEVPIVCCFPVYITRDGTQHFLTSVLKKIQKLGYRLTCVSIKEIELTKRHTLLYLRPDQHVGREILCFLPPGKQD